MSFLKEYISYLWGLGARDYDQSDLQAWTSYLDTAEKDRQRE